MPAARQQTVGRGARSFLSRRFKRPTNQPTTTRSVVVLAAPEPKGQLNFSINFGIAAAAEMSALVNLEFTSSELVLSGVSFKEKRRATTRSSLVQFCACHRL